MAEILYKSSNINKLYWKQHNQEETYEMRNKIDYWEQCNIENKKVSSKILAFFSLKKYIFEVVLYCTVLKV